MSSRERSDEQQIADIRTRDEEHKTSYHERDSERRKQSARAIEWGLPQRKQLDAAPAWCVNY